MCLFCERKNVFNCVEPPVLLWGSKLSGRTVSAGLCPVDLGNGRREGTRQVKRERAEVAGGKRQERLGERTQEGKASTGRAWSALEGLRTQTRGLWGCGQRAGGEGEKKKQREEKEC